MPPDPTDVLDDLICPGDPVALLLSTREKQVALGVAVVVHLRLGAIPCVNDALNSQKLREANTRVKIMLAEEEVQEDKVTWVGGRVHGRAVEVDGQLCVPLPHTDREWYGYEQAEQP